MPNEQLDAKAKAFLVRRYTNVDGWLTDGWLERMTSFAAEQIAAERVRIADELERITNGSSCEINLLIQELREAK